MGGPGFLSIPLGRAANLRLDITGSDTAGELEPLRTRIRTTTESGSALTEGWGFRLSLCLSLGSWSQTSHCPGGRPRTPLPIGQTQVGHWGDTQPPVLPSTSLCPHFLH